MRLILLVLFLPLTVLAGMNDCASMASADLRNRCIALNTIDLTKCQLIVNYSIKQSCFFDVTSEQRRQMKKSKEDEKR